MGAFHILLGAALALASASASAEAWQRAGERLSLPASGLSFPTKAGTLTLTGTGESSLAGEGVDNVAQYKSADGAVFATLFVYLPAYADAALAAYELDKIIDQRYGGHRDSSRVVPAAGVADGAIRRTYAGATFGTSDEKLVTTFAALKAGHWIAVIRVSGPIARRAEAEAALDALIGGVAATGSAHVDPVAEPQVGECPAPSTKPAKPTHMQSEGLGLDDNPGARSLIDAMMAGGVGDKGKPPFPVSIADNGHRPVCIRSHVTVDSNVVDMMQAAGGTSRAKAIIGIVNDAGRTIEMRRDETGDFYLISVHDVARTANYGAFDRPLDPGQIATAVTANPQAGLRSRTTYKADGTFGTEVFVSMGR